MRKRMGSLQRVGVGLSLASSLTVNMGGCSATSAPHESAPRVSPNQTLSRCYTRPLSPQFTFGPGPAPEQKDFQSFDAYEAAEQKWLSSVSAYTAATSPHQLDEPMKHGQPESIPANKPTATILNSVVKITWGKDWGSGFAAEDSYGNTVVVTAAHVAGQTALKNLTVTTVHGRSAHPDGGCYIYEDITYNDHKGTTAEAFTSFRAEGQGIVDEDVAVLTLPNSLGLTALQPYGKSLRRGEWGLLTDYGGYPTPPRGKPDEISGLFVSVPPYNPIYAITGTRAYASDPRTNAYYDRLEPGASGGVVTIDDKYAGLTYGGDSYVNYYDNAAALRSSSDVVFEGAHYGWDTGFAPDIAYIIGEATIQAALNSPRA